MTYRFMVTAFNMEGSTDSPIVSILYAGAPQQPPTSPMLDQSNSNDTQITVVMPLISNTINGNSSIISYNLEMDDGQGGDFTSVGGYSPISMVTTYTVTSGIQRSLTYGFRYRTLNGAGWSPYSDILYAIAATTPAAPPAPTLDSATGSQIVLGF